MSHPPLPPMAPPNVVGLYILAGANIQFVQPTNPDAVIAGIAAQLQSTDPTLGHRDATESALSLLAHAQCAITSGAAGKIGLAVQAEWGLNPPTEEEDAAEAAKRAAARAARDASPDRPTLTLSQD